MDGIIQPMKQETAESIVYSWKYEPPYNFYDMENKEEEKAIMLKASTRKGTYFEILNTDQEVIGFFKVVCHKELNVIELGLGMNPDFTGKGLGEAFINKILTYLQNTFEQRVVLLTVALFNERALHVYKKCGFKPLKTFSMTWAGIEKEYLGMGLQLPLHKGGELS